MEAIVLCGIRTFTVRILFFVQDIIYPEPSDESANSVIKERLSIKGWLD